MMSISFHENLDYSETSISYDDVSNVGRLNNYSPKKEEIHLFAEKLQVPKLKKHFSRPRLSEILTRFSEQIGATLVTGRAGTGKTALAADFARRYERIAWYRVESADSDWSVFSSYFAESFKKAGFTNESPRAETEVSMFLENLFAQISADRDQGSILIVIDDVHLIFDAAWFADFFNSLLYLLNENTHLLLLSRSTPAFPLWRLRSKQVLGVIDEELMAFNSEETAEFLAGYKLSRQIAGEIAKKSFGRIGKLKSLADSSRERRIRRAD